MSATQGPDFETISDSQFSLWRLDSPAPHDCLLDGRPLVMSKPLNEDLLPGLTVQDSDWTEWEALNGELWR